MKRQTIEQTVCEDATGMRENNNGLGEFYSGPINRHGLVTAGGEPLNAIAAREYLEEGGCVAVPNAGAGSYRKVFNALGFHDCKVFEQSSSAGDWTFIVWDGEVWYPAFQSNRFPHYGFDYSVDFAGGWIDVETAFKCMAS